MPQTNTTCRSAKPLQGDVRRTIVCAANIYTDKEGKEVIILGARHMDSIMRDMYTRLGGKAELTAKPNVVKNQGFIDQWRNWISREDALVIAIVNGQISAETITGKELFSEDLY